MTACIAIARSLKSLLVGSALLMGAASAQAELVTNGGFEIGQGEGWTLSGNTAFSFFDDVSPHSGLIGAAFGAPPADPALLSQTLATQAGGLYRVSFWLQNSVAGTAEQPNSFLLNWDGGAAEVTQLNADAFQYTQFSYTFQAASSATDLAFSFGNFAGYWEFDDVSVSAVPEPSSAALLALGLLVCALVASRRHR